MILDTILARNGWIPDGWWRVGWAVDDMAGAAVSPMWRRLS